jgi:hypothetical protein
MKPDREATCAWDCTLPEGHDGPCGRANTVKGVAEGRSSAVPDELEAAKRAMDEYVPSTSDEPLAKRISDEMRDYMAMAHEVSKVYDTLTVGFFSKPNTAAHHVIARVEEIQQKDIDEAVAEALGEPAESREAIRRLREPLENACDAVPAIIEILRREGYVFNRFPRDMRKDPPVGDGERWEALAFSLYAEIAGMATEARVALEDADELLGRAWTMGAPHHPRR